jgi:hypothetical protein
MGISEGPTCQGDAARESAADDVRELERPLEDRLPGLFALAHVIRIERPFALLTAAAPPRRRRPPGAGPPRRQLRG